jgi:hypothetical protein
MVGLQRSWRVVLLPRNWLLEFLNELAHTAAHGWLTN